MITGGTGSFGNAVLKRFLDAEINEIRFFSKRYAFTNCPDGDWVFTRK